MVDSGKGLSGADATGTAVPAKTVSAPRVLSETAPKGSADLLPLPPMMDEAALHTQDFFSLFKDQKTQAAWSPLWTHTAKYDQNKVDLPFPFPTDSRGLIENNQMSITVKGLRALGGAAQARGVLENWLSLGERYTALPGSNQLAELGRAGQPRLSGLLLEEFELNADPDFLRRSYQVVKDDYEHSWSDTYFKKTPNGLNRFCDVDYSHDAGIDESGGAHNNHRFNGDPAPFNPIDLNSHLYRTEMDLAKMSRALGLPSEKWEAAAASRKAKILDQFWDEDKGTFLDFNYKTGERSEVESLAAFTVLESGLLDPSVPREKTMLDRMISGLDKFVTSDSISWDSQTPAPAREVLEVSEGLKKYGFQKEAQGLEQVLRSQMESQDLKSEVEDLSVRAVLSAEAPAQPKPSLSHWMSPKGMARLRGVSKAFGQDSPKVDFQEAGRLDRRLAEFHQSALELPVLNELKQRELLEPVLGLGLTEGGVAAKRPRLDFRPTDSKVSLGGVNLDVQLEGLEVAKLDQGALVLRKGDTELPVAVLGDSIMLGDRVYSKEQFQDGAKLPQALFSNFHTAGGNPTLEQFFHTHRGWMTTKLGPHCGVAENQGRPGWKRLYDLTHDNWDELTIEPSVVDHDTAVQYFNHAAVPSVGIFKTQFNWDTMFMAKGMQLQGQESVVSDMADNLLYLLKSTGRVPNAARSVYLNKSQPPFLPSLVRMCEPIRSRQQGPEAAKKWVKEAYEIMSADFHDFWREDGSRNVGEIDGRKVSLSRWGGANHKFAMDESGFDTASRFYGKTKDLVPPDLNAFLWGYARDMEVIALRLRDQAQAEGNTEEYMRLSVEGSHWGAEKDRIKQDVIDFCWDDEDGMFRDYRFQGETTGLEREEDALSPCVAPLWVGMLDPSNPKEKAMIDRSLDNLYRFEKENGLAATAEDYGHPEMQWNGPSGWAPLQMMAIEAQVMNGRHESAARHTQKWLDTIDKIQARDGVIIERYDMVKGDHPPVQKGRYEETQGEGPGFGWTNATIPWAMVEVIGGVRLHRDPEHPTRMDVIPNIPEGIQGEPYQMTFSDPGSAESYELKQQYDAKAGHYQFEIEGNFTDIANLQLVTPPLPAGLVPKPDTDVPYRLKELKDEKGEVRYRVLFDKLAGPKRIALGFGGE